MANPMHVTHVVLSLDVGGLERNVVNQVRVAPALGQTVSIICLERPGILAPAAEVAGARVVSLNKRPGIEWSLANRLSCALRYLKPDVIHTHQITPLFYVGLAACSRRAPIIIHTEHGIEDYRRLRRRWLGRVAARRAKLFYCLSKDMVAAVTANRIVSRSKVRLIDNGIDTAAYREPRDPELIRTALGIPLGVPLIGTVGRLTEVKRQDCLLRAFARLSARLPDAHLLFVGDGPLIENLRHLAAEFGVSGRVRFAGYQPDAAPYLHAMDAFALTSRSEGTPQALLEACVAGKPVVASAVGGIPEVIVHGQTGLLFQVGDEAALADALADVFVNRDWARGLGLAASRAVEDRFSIHRMSREYDSHFRYLLARRAAGRRLKREAVAAA